MKKIYREITPVTSKDVFGIYNHHNAKFDYPLHHHPEFEINLVMNSNGKRIVGDAIDAFRGNDLALLGPFLPHCSEGQSESITGSPGHVIVIQFQQELFDHNLLSRDDFSAINTLLREASRGIEFYGDTLLQGIDLLKKMTAMEPGFASTIAFFQLLQLLAVSTEKRSFLKEIPFLFCTILYFPYFYCNNRKTNISLIKSPYPKRNFFFFNRKVKYFLPCKTISLDTLTKTAR